MGGISCFITSGAFGDTLLLCLGLFHKLVGNYLIRLFLQNLWNTNKTHFTIAKKFIY